jgi:hypothetical protein
MPAARDVGEPCVGEPHAQFDGRELEPGRGHGHPDLGARRKCRGCALGPTAVQRHRASSLPDRHLTETSATHATCSSGSAGVRSQALSPPLGGTFPPELANDASGNRRREERPRRSRPPSLPDHAARARSLAAAHRTIRPGSPVPTGGWTAGARCGKVRPIAGGTHRPPVKARLPTNTGARIPSSPRSRRGVPVERSVMSFDGLVALRAAVHRVTTRAP